jgi:hypothetical protein
METSNDVKYARDTVIFHFCVYIYIYIYISYTVIFSSQLTVLSAATFYDVVFV